jgi:peptidoglycan/LPS O-acetylase OafA/YrhL
MLAHLFGTEYIDGVYWTLSNELSFYVIIALLYTSGALRKFEITMFVWLGLQFSILAISWIIWRKPPVQPWSSLLTLRYGNLFVTGMLLYRIFHRTSYSGAESTLFRALSSVTMFEWALLAWTVGIATVIDPPALVAIPLIIFVFFLIHCKSLLMAPLRWSTLCFVGTLSYPLYLIHQNLGFALIRQGYLLGLHPLVSIGMSFSASFLLAFLIHHLIEVPGINLGKSSSPKSLLFKRGLVNNPG